MQRRLAVLALVVMCGTALAQDKPAEPQPRKLADLPADMWTQLPSGPANPFVAPVYDPAGRKFIALLAGGNGTAHLDSQTGQWQVGLEPTKAAAGGDQPLMKAYRLLNGRPNFSNMLLYSMVAYDSQRKRIVAGATQFMASYDPTAKAWTDLEAKVPLAGIDYPGVPPVAWGSMCYDPINDEIVQFGGGAVYNWDNWEKHREVTGTFGTWIYSPKTSRWSQPTIGPSEFYKAREMIVPVRVALQEQMTITGEAIVSQLNGENDAATKAVARQAAGLEKVASAIKMLAIELRLLGKHDRLATGADKIEQAAGKAYAARQLAEPDKAVKPREVYAAQFEALKLLESAVQEDLWSHPHSRFISQVVYLPKQKAILLFGGHDGGQLLNDTWLYDCTARTWHRKSPKTLPRARMMHSLVYSDKLGCAVLLGGYTSYWAMPKDELREVWTYDADADDWKLVLADFPFRRGEMSYFSAYSPDDDAIVMLRGGKETFALRLTKTAPLEAPKAEARPVAEDQLPFDPPADDAAVIERWKNLPANTWVQAKPTLGPGARPNNEYGWGMMGYNTRLGCIIMWGGGHSTHQANDIHLYFPGANKWIVGYPPHAINIPPWNKACGNPGGVDWRGGVNNLHARRGVGGNGGKAVITIQTFSPYWYGPQAYLDTPQRWGKTTTFEFDYFSRRWTMPLPLPVADGMNRPYTAKNTTMSVSADGAWWWDSSGRAWQPAAEAKLPAKLVFGGEGGGPFVFAEKRNAVVAIGSPGKGEPLQTWQLELDGGTWKDLKPTGAPPGSPSGSDYCVADDCIYATCFTGFDAKTLDGQEAVYSFKRNAWTIMPTQVEGGGRLPASHSAWTKLVYDPRNNLLIRFVEGSGALWVMRPEFDRLQW